MAPGQVAAVASLLEIMLDPLARTLASAPYDDEPVSAQVPSGHAEPAVCLKKFEYALPGFGFVEVPGRMPSVPLSGVAGVLETLPVRKNGSQF